MSLYSESHFFGWLCTAMAVLGFCVFGVATGVLMSAPIEVIGMDRLGELTCLQMAGNSDRAIVVLDQFGSDELIALKQLLIPGDVVFAWGYGFLFSGLLGLLTIRLSGRWVSVGRVLMWAPLLASVFDVLEDIGLYQLIAAYVIEVASVSNATALLTTISASIKYLLLALIGPAYGISASIKSFASDRHWRSLCLYVLVILLAVSMVQKPLQEIPNCI